MADRRKAKQADIEFSKEMSAPSEAPTPKEGKSSTAVGPDGKFPLNPIAEAHLAITGKTPGEAAVASRNDDAKKAAAEARAKLKALEPARAPRPDRNNRPAAPETPTLDILDKISKSKMVVPTRNPRLASPLSEAQRQAIRLVTDRKAVEQEARTAAGNAATEAARNIPREKPKFYAAEGVQPPYGNPHKKSGKQK